MEEIAAKVRALGDNGVDHARKTNVETEAGCSFHLVGDVEVKDGAAEESKISGVLQRDCVRGRKRSLRASLTRAA